MLPVAFYSLIFSRVNARLLSNWSDHKNGPATKVSSLIELPEVKMNGHRLWLVFLIVGTVQCKNYYLAGDEEINAKRVYSLFDFNGIVGKHKNREITT